jgi:hypothetical protein
MTDSRHPDTDPLEWDSQVSSAALDISQMHTQLLDPPEYMRSLMPTELLSTPSLLPPPSFPSSSHSAHPLHAPLSPVLPPAAERDPRTVAIAAHLRAAMRLNGEANQLLDALKACSAQANAAAQRWFSVMHLERRTPEQAAIYAQLEAQVLTFSRQLADLRQRHAACLAQAREHEDAAHHMQSAAAWHR